MNNSYTNAKLKLISKYSHKIRRLQHVKPTVDTFITLTDFLAN